MPTDGTTNIELVNTVKRLVETKWIAFAQVNASTEEELRKTMAKFYTQYFFELGYEVTVEENDILVLSFTQATSGTLEQPEGVDGSVSYCVKVRKGTQNEMTNTLTAKINATEAELYQVSAVAGSNGTITPLGISKVMKGDCITFRITPAEGYHVEEVLVDNISVGVVSSYTLRDITSSHSIVAFFAKDVGTQQPVPDPDVTEQPTQKPDSSTQPSPQQPSVTPQPPVDKDEYMIGEVYTVGKYNYQLTSSVEVKCMG